MIANRSIFINDITRSRSLWVIRIDSKFRLVDTPNGCCLPVWSTQDNLRLFLKNTAITSVSPLEIPMNLFATTWWYEIKTLANQVGVNWTGLTANQYAVSLDEFEVMAEINKSADQRYP